MSVVCPQATVHSIQEGPSSPAEAEPGLSGLGALNFQNQMLSYFLCSQADLWI